MVDVHVSRVALLDLAQWAYCAIWRRIDVDAALSHPISLEDWNYAFTRGMFADQIVIRAFSDFKAFLYILIGGFS